MTLRVYVPATSRVVADLIADGRLAGPLRAHAVTPALQAAWPDGDDESWEYAALMAAAATSVSLRGAGDRPRRYVVAADVAEARPVPDEDPTLVEVAAALSWDQVVAALVDTVDDAAEDDELAWFAAQEIPDLTD